MWTLLATVFVLGVLCGLGIAIAVAAYAYKRYVCCVPLRLTSDTHREKHSDELKSLSLRSHLFVSLCLPTLGSLRSRTLALCSILSFQTAHPLPHPLDQKKSSFLQLVSPQRTRCTLPPPRTTFTSTPPQRPRYLKACTLKDLPPPPYEQPQMGQVTATRLSFRLSSLPSPAKPPKNRASSLTPCVPS